MQDDYMFDPVLSKEVLDTQPVEPPPFSTGITPQQNELLALTSEECGEVIQVLGKVSRHGLDSFNPNDPNQRTNRDDLTKELGHVLYALDALTRSGIINKQSVMHHARVKSVDVRKWLHFQDK